MYDNILRVLYSVLQQIFVIFLILSFSVHHALAALYADTEILDANQHVIMFERGVDAFLAGDYAKCDDFWLPLARAGDPMAARNMALLYHKGLGVRKDLEEAELFYRIAADKGVTAAQTILGTLLIKGVEFKRDLKDAVRYLNAASLADDPVASWNLALLYEHGVGVSKNMEKANLLFQKAARGGYGTAILRFSKELEGNKPTLEKEIQKAAQKAVTLNKDPNPNFDTRPKVTIPKKKTHQEVIASDKKHDAEHYSDQIHFNKELQQDGPDIIFRDDKGVHEKEQVGIYRELDPFGVEKSKENRLDKSLKVDDIGDNPLYMKANQAYNNKNYRLALQIWQKLFMDTRSDEAAYRLGIMYHDGVGVKKNLYKAYGYWKKGAEAGGEKSSHQLEIFRANLSDKQLLEFEQNTL